MSRSPLLVIVGETASGKTGLAIDLAKQLNGEIICADSTTVRKGLDIGTAKPTIAEQSSVPHHLLDVIGPDDKYSAADFKQQANMWIDDVASRGKLPIMVGGSGLYVDSVLYDYEFREQSDEALRERLNKLSLAELLDEIEHENIPTDNIDTKNKRRLIRLIETRGQDSRKKQLRENTLIFGLQLERAELRRRVELRVDQMLEQGLEDEVSDLSKNYGWGAEGLKNIGYKEWQNYFVGKWNSDKVKQEIIKNTLSLAKRQRTWFKRNKSIQWIDTPVNLKEIVEQITSTLDK